MRRSKSGVFLMEILFAILFFSIAGAVCLELFTKAFTLSRGAKRLNAAVTLCQGAASVIQARGTDGLVACYPNGSWEGDCFVSSANACTLVVRKAGDVCEIQAYPDDVPIHATLGDAGTIAETTSGDAGTVSENTSGDAGIVSETTSGDTGAVSEAASGGAGTVSEAASGGAGTIAENFADAEPVFSLSLLLPTKGVNVA